jgi:formamidopyrimidine-DNA glycosylase
MDQARLSGIGNVYSDEILFQAGLHPKATAGDLEAETVDRLYDTMRRVLEQAIDLGAGDPDFPDRAPKDWLLPHRNKGGRCPRCGGELVKATISGRSAWLCPGCQPQGG